MGLTSTGVLGMGSLAVDSTYIDFVEAQAQAVADAGAHAGLVTYRLTGDLDEARNTAHAFVQANELVG